MNYDEFKNNVIETCNELGIKDYELYYSNSESTSISVFAHEIKSFSSS